MRAGIYKMHVRIANREHRLDQTASEEALGLRCMSKLFCSQLVFKICEAFTLGRFYAFYSYSFSAIMHATVIC